MMHASPRMRRVVLGHGLAVAPFGGTISHKVSVIITHVGHKLFATNSNQRTVSEDISAVATPASGLVSPSANEQNSNSLRVNIAKAVALTGLCSRRQAVKLVNDRRVEINGEKCVSAGMMIDAHDKATIKVDGVILRDRYTSAPLKLWAVQKRVGEIVTRSDQKNDRPAVFDRFYKAVAEIKKGTVDSESSNRGRKSTRTAGDSIARDATRNVSGTSISAEGVYPIFRLDYATEGLCLITNSGVFAKLLDSDPKGTPRYYRARVNGLITESKLDGMRRGLVVDGVKYQSMEVSIQHQSNTMSWLSITSYDQRTTAVKTVLKQLHLNLARLICVGYGPYKLEKVDQEAVVTELSVDPRHHGMYLRAISGMKKNK